MKLEVLSLEEVVNTMQYIDDVRDTVTDNFMIRLVIANFNEDVDQGSETVLSDEYNFSSFSEFFRWCDWNNFSFAFTIDVYDINKEYVNAGFEAVEPLDYIYITAVK